MKSLNVSIMQVAPKDILMVLAGHLPDIRPLSLTCSRIHESLRDHDDFKYWRGGNGREQHLTMKIYSHFKCADVMELVKYDRAELCRLHTADYEHGHDLRKAIIVNDARKVLDEYIGMRGKFNICKYVKRIKSADQYRFLKSRLVCDGLSSTVFQLVCDNRVDLLVSIAAEDAAIRRITSSTAMSQNRPDVILAFIAQGWVESRDVFAGALDRGGYDVLNALIAAGHIHGIPEDRLPYVVPELTPDNFRTLVARGVSISDHIGEITKVYDEKTARLMPEILRLGHKIPRDHAENFIEKAAGKGDLENVLLLRRYLGI